MTRDEYTQTDSAYNYPEFNMYRGLTDISKLPNALAMKNKGYRVINVGAFAKNDGTFTYPFCVFENYNISGICPLNNTIIIELTWIKIKE